MRDACITSCWCDREKSIESWMSSTPIRVPHVWSILMTFKSECPQMMLSFQNEEIWLQRTQNYVLFFICATTEIWQEIRLNLKVSLNETAGLQDSIICAVIVCQHCSANIKLVLDIMCMWHFSSFFEPLHGRKASKMVISNNLVCRHADKALRDERFLKNGRECEYPQY